MYCLVQGARFQSFVNVVNQFLSAFRRNFLVIVSAEEGTSIDGVEFIEEVIDADQLVGRIFIHCRDDVQPG